MTPDTPAVLCLFEALKGFDDDAVAEWIADVDFALREPEAAEWHLSGWSAADLHELQTALITLQGGNP